MDDDDHSDRMARIEAQLEQLAGMAERCRKFILASQILVALGAAVLIAAVLGVVRSDAVVVLGAIAAVLGGLVSLGSNVSTLRQTFEEIADVEALRSKLIGAIDLRVVGDARSSGLLPR
jgi:hypothetical protein